MKASNFFEMTNVELGNKVNELKAELFNLRFSQAAKQLSNPMVLNQTKRDIARAKTILRQRELGLSIEPTEALKKKRSRKEKSAKED
ncbi:MAG: 50S ribosomal protein L29 [Christensenellaceae bacterium]|jgi:large subunit ribosomal protein L29|nr:50S ribosomal protein L29 [Christensenellaceae bacterium]